MHGFFVDDKGSLSIGTITTVCFEKEKILFLFIQIFLFCEAVRNYSDGFLDAKKSPSYVRYH